MSDLAGAFLPMLLFMLFPIMLPVFGTAVGALRDALRGTS